MTPPIAFAGAVVRKVKVAPAPIYIASNKFDTTLSGTSNHPVPVPAHQAGDLLLIAGHFPGGGSIDGGALPSGWAKVPNAQHLSNQDGFDLIYRFGVGGGAANVNVRGGGGAGVPKLYVSSVYRGVSQSDPFRGLVEDPPDAVNLTDYEVDGITLVVPSLVVTHVFANRLNIVSGSSAIAPNPAGGGPAAEHQEVSYSGYSSGSHAMSLNTERFEDAVATGTRRYTLTRQVNPGAWSQAASVLALGG